MDVHHIATVKLLCVVHWAADWEDAPWLTQNLLKGLFVWNGQGTPDGIADHALCDRVRILE